MSVGPDLGMYGKFQGLTSRTICKKMKDQFPRKKKNGKGKMRKASQALALEDSYFSCLSSESLLKQQGTTLNFVIVKKKKDQFVRRF